MNAVPGSNFHQTCRLTASDHARAHAMSFSSRFSSALSAISKIVGATPDFRTVRQSRRGAASSDKESSHGAAIQSRAPQGLLTRHPQASTRPPALSP